MLSTGRHCFLQDSVFFLSNFLTVYNISGVQQKKKRVIWQSPVYVFSINKRTFGVGWRMHTLIESLISSSLIPFPSFSENNGYPCVMFIISIYILLFPMFYCKRYVIFLACFKHYINNISLFTFFYKGSLLVEQHCF